MFVFGTINQLLTDYEDNNEHIFPTDAFPREIISVSEGNNK
jgi:hypothetical protein